MKTQLKKFWALILFLLPTTVGSAATHRHAPHFKVLVVMSYEETFPWCREIKMGIDNVLSASHQVDYFYMSIKPQPIILQGAQLVRTQE